MDFSGIIHTDFEFAGSPATFECHAYDIMLYKESQ